MNSDTPMQNVEELSIRYVMNELDASESARLEKLMMEDPDVLIEIESLRATKRRLSQLQVIEPPAELTLKVLQIAEEKKTPRIKAMLSRMPSMHLVLKYGIAAGLLMASLAGVGYWVEFSSQTNSNVLPNSLKAGSVLPSNGQSPWIDSNDILQIGTTEVSNDSVVLKNAKKLKLLQEPINSATPTRSIQLTRTQ